jgi:uncharacterized Zn-binding protein involved in type VI secretion
MSLQSRASVVTLTLQQTVESTVDTIKEPLPNPLKNPAKCVSSLAGKVQGALSLPADLINNGVAAATNFISDMLPKFPAARLTSLYIGIPHAHAHPPSLIPPAPPIPLPSIGMVMLGTSVKVLMGGLPAARAGDIGLAPTCCGFAPFFTIFLGSSKVFIAGTRAARVTDICTACTPSKDAAVKATAAAMSAALSVGSVVAVVGAVGDFTDAAQEADPNLAAAQALAGGMALAQVAADVAAAAASAAMGTDPAIPPFLPGALVTGAFNVLVAGMPLPNFPDPTQWLLKKLKAKLKKKKDQNKKKEGGGGGCGG